MKKSNQQKATSDKKQRGTKRKAGQIASIPKFISTVQELSSSTSKAPNQPSLLLAVQDEALERANSLLAAARNELTEISADEEQLPTSNVQLTAKQKKKGKQLLVTEKESDDLNKTIEEANKKKQILNWQNKIRRPAQYWVSKDHLKRSKKVMLETGVLYVQGLLGGKEAKALNTAFYLAKHISSITPDRNPIHESFELSKISGKFTMLDVEKSAFKNEELKDCEYALEDLLLKLQRFLGDHWKLGSTLSFLSSGRYQETTKQYIHADSYSGKRYHGLLVLSDEASPTIFRMVDIMPNPMQENINSDKWGKVKDKNDRIKIRQNFAPLLLKEGRCATIEEEMHPISQNTFKKGDVVLFRSDAIHRGPASTTDEDRRMLFFTLYEASYPECQSQLHSCLLGELLYGRLTENQFELIHNTMEVIRDVEPELHTHLSEFDRGVFEEWEHIKYNITHTK